MEQTSLFCPADNTTYDLLVFTPTSAKMLHIMERRRLTIKLLISLRFLLTFTLPFLYDLHIDLILFLLRDYLAVSPHSAAIAAPCRTFAFLELRLDGQLLVRADQ